jgi:hypothetical protein
MDNIYIGQLDKRVEIVKYSDVQSETGAPEHAEETVVTTWAKCEFQSGNEELEGQVISLNIRNYTTRFIQELLNEGEKFYITDIVDGGLFNIHHVEQVGRKEYLILKTSRRE